MKKNLDNNLHASAFPYMFCCRTAVFDNTLSNGNLTMTNYGKINLEVLKIVECAFNILIPSTHADALQSSGNHKEPKPEKVKQINLFSIL